MTDADLPFTEALYASTREVELAPLAWPAEAKAAFLAQQHAAQHAHYREHYKGMEAHIVERGGSAIGRLYLQKMDGELRIVDISLAHEARGEGIGGALLRDVLARAAAEGRFAGIHVERNNPARSLYARLGFTLADPDRGAYEFWVWHPGAPPPQT